MITSFLKNCYGNSVESGSLNKASCLKQASGEMTDFCLNPLSSKGDQRQFSPNHIHTLLGKRDVRINIMISKGEIF